MCSSSRGGETSENHTRFKPHKIEWAVNLVSNDGDGRQRQVPLYTQPDIRPEENTGYINAVLGKKKLSNNFTFGSQIG